MPTKNQPKESIPSWDEVREEASALTREMVLQSLQWSRRAFHVAGKVADMAFSASKEAAERAQETVERVRKH